MATTTATHLFDPKLLPASASAQLPDHLVLRPLQLEDYHRKLFSCLSQLTVAPEVPYAQFLATFNTMKQARQSYTLVIEDTKNNKIVAAGTVALEQKLIRGCGVCGHIEDIVVDKDQRGLKLGLRIIEGLKLLGVGLGCYKIILDCSNKNVPFYEKCGFVLKEVQMAYYPKSVATEGSSGKTISPKL